MEMVLRDFQGAKLVLVGEGRWLRKYQAQVKVLGDRVLFLGRRKDVGALMAAADIFVLPSLREAFGLVLLEATVAGLPIIATDVGGIPEIVENQKTGLLVKSKDGQALASAIKNLLQNPQKCAEFVRAQRERMEAEFTAKEMAEKTGEVYQEILNMKP